MITIHTIEAAVHKKISENGYRVKVSFPDIEMYINGMVVFSPNEAHKNWAIMTPKSLSGKGFRPIEFGKKTQLWADIEDACKAAVRDFNDVGENESQEIDSVMLEGNDAEREDFLKDLPF